MSDKWADYGIARKRLNSEGTHIVKVEVHEDKGNSFGPATERTRSQVVTALEQGYSFVTIRKNGDGKWVKGQDVHPVTVNGVKYIRTDRNNVASDNLGNLPDF